MIPATALLVPGAWMGSWIWAQTAARLGVAGISARSLTLGGLGENDSPTEAAQVRLADHVDQLSAAVEASHEPVVLISHSYSAMVTAQVADRLPERVAGLVHVGGFLPVSGRSLIDEWGDSQEERDAEIAEIEHRGNLWLAPTAEMLAFESDLDADQTQWLSERFRPHPGRTILDPAVMTAPARDQPTTYVAMATDGPEAAWEGAPSTAREAPSWRREYLPSGHWPMLSMPDALTDLLIAEVVHYSSSDPTEGHSR